jgi:hypothetical protein
MSNPLALAHWHRRSALSEEQTRWITLVALSSYEAFSLLISWLLTRNNTLLCGARPCLPLVFLIHARIIITN